MRKKEFMSQMNTKLASAMGEAFYDLFQVAITNKYAVGNKEREVFSEVVEQYMKVWVSIVNHAANNFYEIFDEETVNETLDNPGRNNIMFTLLASIAEIFMDFGRLIESQHEVIALLDSQLSEIAGIENLGNEFNAKMEQLEFERFEEEGTEIS